MRKLISRIGVNTIRAVGLLSLLLASCATVPSPSTKGSASLSTPSAGSSGGGAAASAGGTAGRSTAQLVKEFSGAPATKSDVVIGTRETSITVDAQGRTTSRYQMVFKVMTPAGVDGWSQVSSDWEPWHESRPDIRARVIEPDGSVMQLDPATLIEGSADDPSSQTFSDSRRLRGPLPGVRVGSIVDEVVTVREFQPGLPAGTGGDFYIGTNEPVLTDRFIVEVPESLPLRYKTYLAPELKAHVTRTGGSVRYVFEAHNVPPEADAEDNLPYSDPHWPHVSFSTGKDWNAVAVAYNRYVDAAIHSSDFSKEAAQLRGSNLQTTVRNIMTWMNARVRYTGLYQGNHSIIPTDPRVTLSRGFGDCKDKAVLMAAILRADGWNARLALLLADQATDANPDLPSLGQFNHAIVYVPGKVPAWVDATEEYAEPDVLPLMDQGRHALIIDPSTTGLVSIPVSAARRNTVTDAREFFLTDSGYTDVKEDFRYTGSVEEQARYDNDGTAHADEMKNWSQYVNDKYRFGDLKSFVDSDPRDLAKPFVTDLAIDKAGRGFTGRDLAQAAITTGTLSDWLPDVLTGSERSPRKGDFIFNQPLVATLRYLIHPPIGFTAEPLPQDDEEQLGTMSLTAHYSLLADGSVEAEITLDTGKPRLTASEFEATRKAYAAYQNRDAVIISFDLDGATLMAQGKYRQAFASYRRLVASDPGKSIQLIRYARALLKAGMQEAAAKEIRSAISEEPKSAESEATLAFILEHDAAGRLRGPSYDRTGAIAAYRRAIELDPSDSDYKVDLAHLYEFDADGMRYGPGSDVQKAVALYEQLENTDSWAQVQSDYWNALVWAGDWAKLRKVSESIPPDKNQAYFLALCDLFQKGVDAALARAATIYPDDTRRAVLGQMAQTLFEMRDYPESVQVLRRATEGIPKPPSTKTLLSLLAEAKRYETYSYDPNNPTDVARDYVAAVFSARPDKVSLLKSILTPALLDLTSMPDTKGSIDSDTATIRTEETTSGISAAVLLDLTLPAMHFKVDGSPSTGYRVVMSLSSGSVGFGVGPTDFYLIPEGGRLKVAATDDIPVAIGSQVLDFLDQGQTAAAHQWLDWVVAGAAKPKGKPTDPLATPLVQWFWGSRERNASVAAASLLAFGRGSYSRRAYEELIQARGKLSGMDRDRVDEALVYACLNAPGFEGWALPFAEELFKDHPDSETAFGLYHASLIASGKGGEAGRLDRAWLSKHPHLPDPMALAATNTPDQLSPSLLDSLLDGRIRSHTVTSSDYNERAWTSLFFPPVSQTMVEYARRAVDLTKSKDRAVLNTLAAVYAARGKCQEAYKTLVQDMNLSEHLAIQPEDWYVLGMIAEQCGMPEAAITYYKRVTDVHGYLVDPNSPYVLAQERLAALEAAAPGKSAEGRQGL